MVNKKKREINEPGHRLKKSAERGFDRMTTLIICFGFSFVVRWMRMGKGGHTTPRRTNWDIENSM